MLDIRYSISNGFICFNSVVSIDINYSELVALFALRLLHNCLIMCPSIHPSVRLSVWCMHVCCTLDTAQLFSPIHLSGIWSFCLLKIYSADIYSRSFKYRECPAMRLRFVSCCGLSFPWLWLWSGNTHYSNLPNVLGTIEHRTISELHPEAVLVKSRFERLKHIQ